MALAYRVIIGSNRKMMMKDPNYIYHNEFMTNKNPLVVVLRRYYPKTFSGNQVASCGSAAIRPSARI